jgi:uncharacterized membrane protein
MFLKNRSLETLSSQQSIYGLLLALNLTWKEKYPHSGQQLKKMIRSSENQQRAGLSSRY